MNILRTPSKTVLIAKRLINMVITGTPLESGCILLSYLIYLSTGHSAWLYYGITAVGILHYLNGTKHYHASLLIYLLFLSCAFFADFPNTLLCTSILTALICLTLNNKKPVSTRIYQLGKHFFIAFYCTAYILFTSVIVYIIASIILKMPEELKQILTHVCIFIFSVILPILFFAIDTRNHYETPTIPKILGWLQLIFIETILHAGSFYLVFCIFQMVLHSLAPRPYVVYIVIAIIIAIEISAKLHEWAPKNWNDSFYSHRILFYIPIIFLGIASLYIEYSIIGCQPRTIAASILLGWISIISIARLINCHRITMQERTISLYASIILTIIIGIIPIIR